MRGPSAPADADRPLDKPSHVGVLAAAVWLVFLGQPLSVAWQAENQLARWIGLSALVGFGVAYVLTFRWLRFRGHEPLHADGRSQWMALTGLGVLTALSMPAAGQAGTACFVFLGAATAMALRGPRRLIVLAGLLLLSIVLPPTVPGWTSDFSVPVGIVLASVAVFGITKVIERNHQLARAYAEIARLAVTEERHRIGRDMHDILGHSLTVITVKAELAGRLLPNDVDRASVEVADIERLAREALSDVRTTIAGNRRVTLAVEIANARSALSGAGIEAELPNALDAVAGDRRELFGWAVREGVTNVVRHSGANKCVILVDANCLEVLDDGAGAPGTSRQERAGHGLQGLRERVEQAGGRLQLGRAETLGGFRLQVLLPELPR